MAPQKTVTLADDIYEQLTQRAEAEGKTLDEAANEAIQTGLEQASWAAFIAKGRKYGEASGYKPEDLERLREEWRNEQPGR
jgi:predicted CopG family antitoxin